MSSLALAPSSEIAARKLAPTASQARGGCLHCDQPLGTGSVGDYCCRGCEAVYALLRTEELDRFYLLRGKSGSPVIDRPSIDRDLSWLAEARITAEGEDLQHYQLDVQGLHCSGCVWILEKTFGKCEGARRVIVNPARGSVDLWVAGDFDVPAWIHSVERFGYRFGPRLKTANAKSDALLLRLGICVALAINTMLLSVALYLGLDDGRLYDFVRNLSYGLTTATVLIGGPVFFRSAWAGLRQGVLHLDVPISLGIVLAYTGSSWAFWSGSDRALYLDSVSVFVALMLVGRYLQERVLIANRMRLLASDGTAGLRSRRMVDGRIDIIKSRDVRAGDRLSIAPGDLIPVDARLESGEASISLEWIRGESRQTRASQGARLPAGAFNVGRQAVQVECLSDFSASPLQALLEGQACASSAECGAKSSGLAQIITRFYVVGVLAAAAIGCAAWLVHSGSVARALEVATAVLVVTCPCAFGIAAPLAHELVLTQLRRRGLYLRSADFLVRAQEIKTIVFDKTGTLTTGLLQVANPVAIAALSADERELLFALASQSSHPSSMAICRAMPDQALVEDIAGAVEEVVGMGMRCQREGIEYRLGRATWACQDSSVSASEAPATVFSRQGVPLAELRLTEELRSDAVEVLQELRNDGYELFLLSGDSEDRVLELAAALDLPPSHAIGACSPEDKRDWLAERDHADLLFLGDGINDSLAAQQASFSGTPALDRPFMASSCDFYLGTETLSPVFVALRAARRLSAVIRRNFFIALGYNALAIGLAWAGLMQPWLAALLMPASSILLVLATTHALSARKLVWTS